jgi:hypothetical protein
MPRSVLQLMLCVLRTWAAILVLVIIALALAAAGVVGCGGDAPSDRERIGEDAAEFVEGPVAP